MSMIIATIVQLSLSDPPQSGVLAPAANWIADLVFGPLATAIAVIAIAWIGFAMLSGHVDIRRGLSVLLGCFLLFGAKGIIEGLRPATDREYLPAAAIVPSQPVYQGSSPPGTNTNAFDPYAGAAVPDINSRGKNLKSK
jgi:type IV secretory pathway VirB2 component (pilin)